MANLLMESRAPRPATSLLDPSTSLRAGSRDARRSTLDGRGARRSTERESRWKMEVYVVPGGDWCAVERGRLVVPAAQGGFDLFVDPVADRLHNFGFDDVALRVDRDFNDDVALQVPGKLGARYGRIWIHDWIRDVDFMAGDRSVNHCDSAQRRSGAGIVIAGFRVGNCNDLLWLWCRL